MMPALTERRLQTKLFALHSLLQTIHYYYSVVVRCSLTRNTKRDETSPPPLLRVAFRFRCERPLHFRPKIFVISQDLTSLLNDPVLRLA